MPRPRQRVGGTIALPRLPAVRDQRFVLREAAARTQGVQFGAYQDECGGKPMAARDQLLDEVQELALRNDMEYLG